MTAWQPEPPLTAEWRCSRALSRSLAALGVLLWGSGCAPVPPETPVDNEGPRPASAGPLVAEGDIGGLSQEDVDEAFQKLAPEVQHCAEGELSRNEALGGDCTVRLRIGRDGQARWAYLADSTLGDRSAEQCILSAVRARAWPKPLGGEGEAVHSFAVESGTEVPSWSSEHVRLARGLVQNVAAHCALRRAKGRFSATVYVRADGSVLATGIALPSAQVEAEADCVVAGVQKLNFGRQKSRLSKATFRIP